MTEFTKSERFFLLHLVHEEMQKYAMEDQTELGQQVLTLGRAIIEKLSTKGETRGADAKTEG